MTSRAAYPSAGHPPDIEWSVTRFMNFSPQMYGKLVSSGDRMQTAKSSNSTGSRKFSTEQTTALNSFYKNGMKGEAARFTVFISRASKKTGLSIAQVKVDLALI